MQGVKLHLVETLEDVQQCMTWLEGLTCRRLGFDTETTGLSPEVDTVRLVQFGDAQNGWAIPVDRWLGLAETIVDRWASRGGRFVAHNARYDVAMLRNHGIHVPVHLVDDTMVLAQLNIAAADVLSAAIVDAVVSAGDYAEGAPLPASPPPLRTVCPQLAAAWQSLD